MAPPGDAHVHLGHCDHDHRDRDQDPNSQSQETQEGHPDARHVEEENLAALALRSVPTLRKHLSQTRFAIREQGQHHAPAEGDDDPRNDEEHDSYDDAEVHHDGDENSRKETIETREKSRELKLLAARRGDRDAKLSDGEIDSEDDGDRHEGDRARNVCHGIGRISPETEDTLNDALDSLVDDEHEGETTNEGEGVRFGRLPAYGDGVTNGPIPRSVSGEVSG